MAITFKGILDTIGNDAKKVFAFLGSASGQKDVAVVEGAVDTVVAAVDPLLVAPIEAVQTLIGNWIAEAFKVQALAAAAGATTGSNTQKEAIALTGMVPQITSFLQTQGLSTTQVTSEAGIINSAVVTILNTLGSGGPAVVTQAQAQAQAPVTVLEPAPVLESTPAPSPSLPSVGEAPVG
jgi:hypothetical protein